MILSLSNESVHEFINIRNGRVKTGFQMEKIKRFWSVLIKKPDISLRDILVHWR